MKATCGGCDTEWAGETKRAHCACCHHTFSTPHVFDTHRWARGRGTGCYTPQELGLTLIDGTWYNETTTEGGHDGSEEGNEAEAELRDE